MENKMGFYKKKILKWYDYHKLKSVNSMKIDLNLYY